MGNPLQDQLLKAGLVDKKQVNKAKLEKRKKRKKKKGKPGNTTPQVNRTRQEQLRKAKENREQNIKQNAQRQQAGAVAQVRQLVKDNRLDLKDGQEPYYFALGKKIKKVWVDKETANKLSAGRLAVVRLDEVFDVVPAKVAKQIQTRSPETVVLLHDPENTDPVS